MYSHIMYLIKGGARLPLDPLCINNKLKLYRAQNFICVSHIFLFATVVIGTSRRASHSRRPETMSGSEGGFWGNFRRQRSAILSDGDTSSESSDSRPTSKSQARMRARAVAVLALLAAWSAAAAVRFVLEGARREDEHSEAREVRRLQNRIEHWREKTERLKAREERLKARRLRAQTQRKRAARDRRTPSLRDGQRSKTPGASVVEGKQRLGR